MWLRADLETLVRRTARRTDRPLLNNADPAKTLESLMETRHPVYAQADIVVESNDGPPDETVERVVDAVVAFRNRTKASPAQ